MTHAVQGDRPGRRITNKLCGHAAIHKALRLLRVEAANAHYRGGKKRKNLQTKVS
jgi:hypothetical protein